MVRCAVLGHPVDHSLSPVMHRAAYAALGLAGWTYEALDVDEAGVQDLVRGLDRSWRGLSVTKPLKRAVIPALAEVGATAREVGAVNTVTMRSGRRRGDNTDVPGAVAALRERGVDAVGDAVVIGAGATAASLVAALRALGLRRLTIAARDEARAAPLADLATSWGLSVTVEPVDERLPRRTDVLASTVPSAVLEPYAAHLVRHAGAVFDVIYEPWPTALVGAARSTGPLGRRDAATRPVVSGLDLLAHQGALQVELFTGTPVPADLLRTAAHEALARR